MKRIVILTIMAALLLPVTTSAQSGNAFGGFGYYQPGLQFFMPNNLNNYFPIDYPLVDFNSYYDAGGGFAVFYNFIIGGEGGSYRGGSFVNGNRKVDLSGEFSALKMGYTVYKKRGLMIYPLLGFVRQSMTIYVHQVNQAESFNRVLENPNIASTLVLQNANLTISAAFMYEVFGAKKDNMVNGMVVGMEAGYQLPAFGSGKWTYDNGPIMSPTAPVFDLPGFFLRLIIGGGGLYVK